MTITTLELDALRPKEKPYMIREKQHNKKDGTLAFKILPTGEIDGYFIYYIGGKEKQKKIGRYGKAKNLMSLKVIRDRYTELSKEYQTGVDVKEQALKIAAAQERERQEQATIERKKQMQGSFQQLVDLYIEHARVNLSRHYYNSIKGAFALNLKAFDTATKANEITKADINNILRPIKSRGALVMANRMRSYLSAAFEWARDLESDEEEITGLPVLPGVQFFIEVNPVVGVKKALQREEPTDRFLTESEVRAFIVDPKIRTVA